MIDFIPVNEPLLDGNEKKYLLECIETGWISSEGPFVKQFEQKFAARMGRKYGVAVSNGTAAIDAAVDALGIGPGDESSCLHSQLYPASTRLCVAVPSRYLLTAIP